ncbi:MAG: bifunctional adenosylcobinamide kinase/adenosylcobinamide-phosphate guanylyltransferase [Brevinematales bacterium]|nr:bifunctional adenosylcobinamide kinase/adenosylcobinamide-phosphate guanylyltransferase [Brevinematales bacterium]
MAKMILVTGGRRSGKSSFAERYALEASEHPLYVATGVELDEEFRIRIEHHRTTRDKRFLTIEEPFRVKEVIEKQRCFSVIVWECVTMWLANHFHARGWVFPETAEKSLKEELVAIVECVQALDHTLIVVTNEIGLGVIPADEVSRRYGDVLGRYNQYLASVSDEVYFLVSGIPWRLK